MQKKTLQEVINDLKAGKPVDSEECKNALLALYSMFTRSRMALEVVAENTEDPARLQLVARVYLHDLPTVRQERLNWLAAIPSQWLKSQDAMEKEIYSIYKSVSDKHLRK